MSEQMANMLRQKIVDSGLSANKLSQLVDVKQVTISAFLRGDGISLATAQKIADHFGLELQENPGRKKA